jgi:hypothetical protein
MTVIAHRVSNALLTKTPAAQSFPVILTIGNVAFSCTTCIVMRSLRCVVEVRATRAPASVRQHFLKRTLFFLMCWCIRDAVHFDSRVHAAIK